MRRRNRKKVIIILSVFFLLVVASLCIGVGLYFDSLSHPKNVVGSMIQGVQDEVHQYLSVLNPYVLGDDFSVESDFSFDLDSEYYLRMMQTQSEEKTVYPLLQNLNQMNTKVFLQQSKSDNLSYFQIHETLNSEELLNYRSYVQDSTRYYSIDGIVPTYVNDGTCNYFEFINEEASTQDNIDYLYDFFFQSLRNNIKDSYFDTYKVDTNVSGKVVSTHQFSMKLSNKMIRSILSGILNDFKNDERANGIISSIDADYYDVFNFDDMFFLKSGENYTINLYSTSIFYKPVKLEIIYLKGNTKKVLSYEISEDGGILYYIENDRVVYQIPITYDGKVFSFDIKNSQDEALGFFHLECSKDSMNFDYVFDDGTLKHDFVYSSKYLDANKNFYTNEKKLAFKIVKERESILSGTVMISSFVQNKFKISEDITDSVLSSTLSNEQKDQISHLKEKIRERLEM